MNPRETIEAILSVNAALKPPTQPLSPYLVGPTGAGKTTLVKELAAQRGLPVVTLLLASMSAEEVLGIPRSDKSMTMVWCIPQPLIKAVKEPVILLLDEIDKARRETVSVVLTLLASREVHGRPLHPGTIIITAGQPIPSADWQDETMTALRARLVVVPVAPSSMVCGRDWSSIPAAPVEETWAIPYRVPRLLAWAHTAMSVTPEENQAALLEGCLGKQIASLVVDAYRNDQAWVRDRMADAIVQGQLDTATVSPQDLSVLLPALSQKGTPAHFCQALARIRTMAGKDEVDAAIIAYEQWLSAACDAGGGQTEIFKGYSMDDYKQESTKIADVLID